MKIELKNRWTNKIILCGEYESIKDCLQKNRYANLRDADLRGADLRDANLGGVDLGGVDLRYANLGGANLGGVDLRGADLRGANLGGVDLRYANLRGADLRGANLGGVDLRYANLGGANLGGADLGGADLRGADLGGAKNYYNSHDFAQEIIRRQPTKTFTEKEWAIIGQILVHRLCWETIKKRWNKKALPIFKKLKKADFGEFEKEYTK